jgi:hypothetical protein
MDGTAACDLRPDDVIDEVRYLNDLEYRRSVHEDLEIEGDEPIDLSSHPDADLVFDSMEALSKFMDDMLEEVLRDIATGNRAHTPRT